MSVLQSNLLNTDTKGTKPSVLITEVSVLQSNFLNADTKGTETTVLTTEVSVLLSSLLILIPKGQSKVSALQRCLYYSLLQSNVLNGPLSHGGHVVLRD